jgi:hypothetical protein
MRKIVRYSQIMSGPSYYIGPDLATMLGRHLTLIRQRYYPASRTQTSKAVQLFAPMISRTRRSRNDIGLTLAA